MYDLKIAPTVDKIKTELSETLTISKTTLSLTLLDMGFMYRKRGDNRNLLIITFQSPTIGLTTFEKLSSIVTKVLKWFI